MKKKNTGKLNTSTEIHNQYTPTKAKSEVRLKQQPTIKRFSVGN